MADSILDKVLSSKHAEEISHFSPQETLQKALAPLSERDRTIVVQRFALEGKPLVTLEEIGKRLEVTRERVRQIERSAIKKIKSHAQFSATIDTVMHIVRQYLEEAGGALCDEELYASLLLGHDRASSARPIMHFILHELVNDRLQRIPADSWFREGWALQSFSLVQLKDRLQRFEAVLEEKREPLSLEKLFAYYRAKHPEESFSDEQLQATILCSARLQRNVFGAWGLHSWATIHPRRMNDKIYIILKQEGKPLHFNAITDAINTAKFDQKIAYAPTVHNELIMDKRFVLVGRGTYALQEWGFKPGIVADVIMGIIKERGTPMDRDAIVHDVLQQRFVGKATVHLALTDQKRFIKLPDGRYTLAEQSALPSSSNS